MARRKNRMENGIRALWFGSNPHSNGEAFSREEEVGRIDRIQAIIYTSKGRAIATEDAIRVLIMYSEI